MVNFLQKLFTKKSQLPIHVIVNNLLDAVCLSDRISVPPETTFMYQIEYNQIMLNDWFIQVNDYLYELLVRIDQSLICELAIKKSPMFEYDMTLNHCIEYINMFKKIKDCFDNYVCSKNLTEKQKISNILTTQKHVKDCVKTIIAETVCRSKPGLKKGENCAVGLFKQYEEVYKVYRKNPGKGIVGAFYRTKNQHKTKLDCTQQELVGEAEEIVYAIACWILEVISDK
ncbi:MAG: hypothetical protein AAF620_00115 [Bacteroidota bacterium]